jgi:hypothetical protein
MGHIVPVRGEALVDSKVWTVNIEVVVVKFPVRQWVWQKFPKTTKISWMKPFRL